MNDVALSNALLPPVVRAVLSCLLFTWLVVALGQRALRVLRVSLSLATVWEKAFVAGALGAGLLQYLPYGLAAFGLMKPEYVRTAVTVLIVLLSFDLFTVARSLRRALARTSLRFTPTGIAWGALFASLLTILLVRASTIGFLSDDDGYHLASPKRWLALGTLAYLPTYTNTNACLGFEMLYAIGLSVWDAVAAKAFNYTAGLFALYGVWLCAKRLSGTTAALTAISLLLIATPIVHLPFVFALAYVDLGACWMAMACVLLWLLWRERQDTRLLVIMALCAGFVASFKTTAIATGIAWAPAIVIELRRRGIDWKQCSLKVVSFGMVSLLPVLPWFFRSFRVTGNPLYPMLSSVVPTRDWNAAQAAVFGKYVHYYTWAIGAGSKLAESQRKEIVFGAAAAIAVVGGLLVARVRRPELRSIALFALVFTFISVCLTGLVFRYWLPAFMSAYLVGCIVLIEHPRAQRWGFLCAPALMALALLIQLRQNPSGHDLRRDVRLASGSSTLDQEYADAAPWRTWQYLNAHTPANAHVLLAAFYTTFSASSYGAFWVDRTCYTTDSHLQMYIRFDSWPKFLQTIQKASIGYVVIADQQSSVGRQGFSFPAGENEYPFCRRLVSEYGTQVYQSGNLSVYQLAYPR